MRFAKEGRTLEAAYTAWNTFAFDPNKADTKQFVGTVEDLAKKLGYNEDVQVMAVKSGVFHGRSRGRGRFNKSPHVRCPRVVSKTVDKDKMRCHYCNEFGHFIRECLKWSR